MKTLDELTTAMMEHICDNMCRFPRKSVQEELEIKCADCKMGQFVCDLLNTEKEFNKLYLEKCQEVNKLNDENRWISVSERLPEVRMYENGEPKSYQTMIKGAEVPTELYVDYNNKWHSYDLVYYYHDYREFNVIAWKPLPEPYKECDTD